MTNDAELERERAVNERYRRHAEERRVALFKAAAAGRSWAGPDSRLQDDGHLGPLAGRVGFDEPDPLLGSSFYVGPYHLDEDGFTVVSFAAPLASLFYEGTDADRSEAASVLARRTLVAAGFDIKDYYDEFLQDAVPPGTALPFEAPGSPLGGHRELPRAAVRPVARPVSASPLPVPAATVEPDVGADAPADGAVDAPLGNVGAERGEALAPAVERGVSAPTSPLLRAEPIVIEALEAPRTGHLHSLLATLQPDQYELVTWPEDSPLIIQGHPGTGKTVIAAHRAAYLVHPDRESTRAFGNVLMVGPTDRFVNHVAPVLHELGAARVFLMSMPTLLARLASIEPKTVALADHVEGIRWELGRLLDVAATRWLRSGGTRYLKRFVNELTHDTPLHREVFGGTPDLSAFVQSARNWNSCSTQSRYFAFLAAAAVALSADDRPPQVDHVIVDEAQDIRPLEWRILHSITRRPRSFTLLGDINQRRTLYTESSWEQLAIDTELTDHQGQAPVRVLTTGYRSTQVILDYAGRLLPRGSRKMHALRQGTPPRVRRIGADYLLNEAENEAVGAADRLGGQVAIILANPDPLLTRLRQDRSWKRGVDRGFTNDRGHQLFVLSPEDARGLEFDAVVVVEPDDFPQPLGHRGPLYTSLTRATKELVVLHSKSLPSELRQR